MRSAPVRAIVAPLDDAPRDTPPDLVERYRQLKPFDEAEVAFVRACVRRPDRLPRVHEATLRLALNLARLWVLRQDGGEDLVVGPHLGAFRDKVAPLALRLRRAGDDLDPGSLGRDAVELAQHLTEARSALLTRHSGRVLSSALDKELGTKALVILAGGGGGCGYVHLGAFSVLESRHIVPRLIVGASIGSILGMFRAREEHYRDSMVRAVTHGLTFKKLFRVLEVQSRFGVPGPLRLYLRSALSRFFVAPGGEAVRIGELTIPFICVVTGIRREAIRRELYDYEKAFARELSRGAFSALLHVKDLISSWASLIGDLVATQGAMKPVAIGADADTLDFDVVDAVGFSCSVPALIHYDILRDDPRMESQMLALLAKNQVDVLVDGGVTANVPARVAWESVQRGRIGTRNVFILGLDCFAPQLRRNMLFLPLQRIAAENVARDRAFSQMTFQYKKVLSPAALVPGPKSMAEAVEHGREEFERESPFIQKMMEPLPALPSLLPTPSGPSTPSSPGFPTV